MIPFRFVKEAGVSAGFGPVFGSPFKEPARAPGRTSSDGKSDVPVCKKCGHKLKPGSLQCQNCGTEAPATKQGEKEAEEPDQGPASDDLMKVSNFGVELGKNVLGGGLLIGTGYAGAQMAGPARQMALEERKRKVQALVATGQLPESELLKFSHLEKQAARKTGNPIFNLRHALTQLRNSSGKIRASMVYAKE